VRDVSLGPFSPVGCNMPTRPPSPDDEPESPGPVPPQREIPVQPLPEPELPPPEEPIPDEPEPVQPPAHDPIPPAPKA